jgi:hypothetical protein
MDKDFRLLDDDTMVRLRAIAQSPSELAWRMELLATLERMRMQSHVSTTAILQNQQRFETKISHLTLTKITQIVNTQIEEKLKPRDRDVNRLWDASMWLLEKVATVGIAVACALVGLKLNHP